MRSNSGQLCRNSRYSLSLQKPMTCSTPARLYQLRSNRTISPAAGRCGTIALEVPLRFFPLGGSAQRHHAADARIQALGDPLDRATFSGGIPTFEEGHEFQALMADPLL